MLRPKHVLPSLATIKTMLISFQCRSLIAKRRAHGQQLKWLTAKKFKQVTFKEKDNKATKGVELTSIRIHCMGGLQPPFLLR